jgi:predicted negative regulator of RcsB-dependent stress response
MDILDLPDDLKQKLRDSLVEFVARQAEMMPGGDKAARIIKQLSSQAVFYNAFDQAMPNALKRFQTEYTTQDEDLVAAIITDGKFWHSKDVRVALMALLHHPGSWLADERETVLQHFADVLPRRVNRDRVDKAITYFLGCVLEELWTLPGVREIREIYSLQFQKIGAEAARQQVALLEAQLRATTQLSDDVRQGLLQLAAMLEQRLLAAPPLPVSTSPRPYHNLPQPDYTSFVGRRRELGWLRQHLSPNDRAWQMVIAGIGGVGKSALALAIADFYREHYNDLPAEDCFEAIIWITAKEEMLTIKGRERRALPGLITRTLEDMYTTISQTLQREDITRALTEEQDRLVQKALREQRALLIVDNLESVTDERVRLFLYNLPAPTKCIITSREWVDVAAVLKLKGLSPEEAENLITEEAMAREVKLDVVEQQRLIERTAGLPLPIKLSIARMASGEMFDQVMRWLGNYSAGDLSDYCIKGQIDVVRQLDLNAWKLLLACSLFDQEAGASREALGSIADLSLADRDDGLTLLQQLSLLNRTEDDRFGMLPMVQEYVEAECLRIDFGEETTKRWIGWLLEFSQLYGATLDFHIERAQMVGLEYPNLLRAIHWCYEHEWWEMLLQFVEGTWFYPYLVGLFSELREILKAAVQAAKALRDEQREGRFTRRLVLPFWAQGQFTGEYAKEVTEYLDKAREIAIRYNNEAELGLVEHTCVDVLFDQGHLIEAEQLAKTVLEIGERVNNPELKILGAYRMALIESKKEHFDKALESLDQCDQWCKELNWKRRSALIMYYRGATLLRQGNATAAEQFLEQSLNLVTSWNERRFVALNKLALAQAYSDTYRIQLALQMAKEARDLCERLGMTLGMSDELSRKLLGKDDDELIQRGDI